MENLLKSLEPYHINRRTGELIAETCPFCHGGKNHDTRTFALNLSTGAYNCMRGSCGKKGNIRDLINLPFTQLTSLKMPTGQTKTYQAPRTEILPITQECLNYLLLRKITPEAIEECKIGSDKNGNITIPFYENGNLVLLKFRKPHKHIKGEPKEWAEAGGKFVLYNIDNCVYGKPLVVCEGELDCLSIVSAGYSNVVSVPSGTNNLDFVDLNWLWLDKFDKIILFGDSDEPGKQMVQMLSKRLGESRCAIVENYPSFPENENRICKDANEILYFYGAEKILEMINTAELVPAKGLLDLSEVVPEDPTTIPRIKTNIPALDKTLGGLMQGAVTIFTGRAGNGKSTLTGLLLLEAIEQGHKVCAYSGELNKQLFQQWINLQCAGSEYIGLKYDKLTEREVPYIEPVVQQAIRDWYKGKFFLFDNTEVFEKNQEEAILQVFDLAAKRYGCKLFLVDNMMTAVADADGEKIHAQSRFINALKTFANHYNAHVLLVAHPRKTKQGETLQKDDVGGSSEIVNLADSAIVVERPNLRIIKNRNGGINTLIECVYCRDSRRIYQADVGDRFKFSFERANLPKPKQRADGLAEYGIQLANTMPF